MVQKTCRDSKSNITIQENKTDVNIELLPIFSNILYYDLREKEIHSRLREIKKRFSNKSLRCYFSQL